MLIFRSDSKDNYERNLKVFCGIFVEAGIICD